MHPHTPQDRRTFESAEWTPPAPQNDRTRVEGHTRHARTATLVTVLSLAVIVALIILL